MKKLSSLWQISGPGKYGLWNQYHQFMVMKSERWMKKHTRSMMANTGLELGNTVATDRMTQCWKKLARTMSTFQ